MKQANSRHDIEAEAEDENPVTARYYLWALGATWSSGVLHDMYFEVLQYDEYGLYTSSTTTYTIAESGVYSIVMYGAWEPEVVPGDNSYKENHILINGASPVIGGDRYQRDTHPSASVHPACPIGFTRYLTAGDTISCQSRQFSGNDKAYTNLFDEPHLTITFLGL